MVIGSAAFRSTIRRRNLILWHFKIPSHLPSDTGDGDSLGKQPDQAERQRIRSHSALVWLLCQMESSRRSSCSKLREL